LRAHREGLPLKGIDEGAIERLKRHSWPGNVRELENLMRRISALYAEDVITSRAVEREFQEHASPVAAETPLTLEDLIEQRLSAEFADAPDVLPPPGLYDRIVEEVSRPLIRLTLNATRGNQVKAADVLGVNRNTLRKKIQDLGLDAVRRRG
jgi:two-component system nitrogen regulation response regulator GlnG